MDNFQRCKLLGDQLEWRLAKYFERTGQYSDVRITLTKHGHDIELVRQLANPARPGSTARESAMLLMQETETTWYDCARLVQKGRKIELVTFVEVKYDLESANSGRIAVELAFKDTASGLQASDAASLWAYGLGGTDEVLLIYRSDFRRLIAENRAKIQYLHGGDGNESYMALIPLDVMRQGAGVTILHLQEDT